MKRIVVIVLLGIMGRCQAAEEQKKSASDLNQKSVLEQVSSLNGIVMGYKQYHKALRALVKANPILQDRRIDAQHSVIVDGLSNLPGLFFDEDSREEIKKLCGAGVPIDQVDRLGCTALHRVVLSDGIGNMGKGACIRLLLDFKADPTKLDDQGNSPVALAVKQGLPAFVPFAGHPKVFNQHIFIDGVWKSYASVIKEPTPYGDTQRYLQANLAHAPVTSLKSNEPVNEPFNQDSWNQLCHEMREHKPYSGLLIMSAFFKHQKELSQE